MWGPVAFPSSGGGFEGEGDDGVGDVPSTPSSSLPLPLSPSFSLSFSCGAAYAPFVRQR